MAHYKNRRGGRRALEIFIQPHELLVIELGHIAKFVSRGTNAIENNEMPTAAIEAVVRLFEAELLHRPVFSIARFFARRMRRGAIPAPDVVVPDAVIDLQV